MAKGQKRRRVMRAAGDALKRGGKSFAKKFREKRTKGLVISAAVAGVAGWYESDKTNVQLALYDSTPGQESLTKVDAVGLAATGVAMWTGNEMAYDVAAGLLPLMVHRMVRARVGSGRPPKAEPSGYDDESGADDETFAGAVELEEA